MQSRPRGQEGDELLAGRIPVHCARWRAQSVLWAASPGSHSIDYRKVQIKSLISPVRTGPVNRLMSVTPTPEPLRACRGEVLLYSSSRSIIRAAAAQGLEWDQGLQSPWSNRLDRNGCYMINLCLLLFLDPKCITDACSFQSSNCVMNQINQEWFQREFRG